MADRIERLSVNYRALLAAALALNGACATSPGSPSEVPTVVIAPATSQPDIEAATENPLADYERQYAVLPNEHKNGFTWQQASERLTAHPEELKKALAMQGGGQIFYVTPAGEIRIKDKGSEPVMYGFDAEGRLLTIYDRNPDQMELVQEWANGIETQTAVMKEGYSLFADDGNYGLSEDMLRAAAINGSRFFVASRDKKDRNDFKGSRLKNDRFVLYSPKGIGILDDFPEYRSYYCGAVRWLSI